jgi:multiple antibiotic resistance protein
MGEYSHFSWKEIITISLTLFAVIDIIGSIPIVINLKQTYGKLKAAKTTLVAGTLMVVFLYFGGSMLSLLDLDIKSFAIAGSIVIFLIGLEMILGHSIFKPDANYNDISVVPLAFPLIAGAGVLTTLLSMKSAYKDGNILVGILINLIIVFFVLKFIPFIEKKLGAGGIAVLRRIFGIILIAIAVKIFKSNTSFIA